MTEGITDKDKLHRKVTALKSERASFISHYREISEFISPRRGRYMTTDRNKGEKRHQSIINSAGTQALRTARAGMLAGVMSPARPWFTLQTPDPDMMEFQPVKEWLYKIELMQRAIFNAGNLYNMSPVLIGEMLQFGTGCMTHVDDFNDVARFYTHTAGSYMLAQNERLQVDTIAREYEMTVLNMVSQFGLKKCSTTVQNLYSQGNYYAWVPTIHCIYPNEDQDPSSPMAYHRPTLSVYYEPGNNLEKAFLRRSGFKHFPAYCPRWEVTGEDVYGTDCPGMTALGDVKGLQIEEKRKAQAIDKMVNPPLAGPASLKNQPVSALPGGLTVYDMAGGENAGLRPIYQVTPNLRELREDMSAVERRIQEAFYVDLFMAITNMEGIQPRNQFELAERNAEKLLQLGPVLERLHGEFLNALIDRTFEQMVEAKILPPPPQELAGQALKVEYVSTLAQAQRAVATSGIDRVAAFAGGLFKGGVADAWDKFDSDQAIDEYAKVIGVPPRIVVPDERVAEIRQARAKEQMAAQKLAMMQQGAETAKTVSETDTSGENALTDIVGGGQT